MTDVTKSRAVACDVGTMFFQAAEILENDEINIKTTRNAFVELANSDDIEDVLKQNNWQYIKDGDVYYVIGEDSLRVAKMFPGRVELRRPLQDGVLNKGEDKKILVLGKLIEDSVGLPPDENSVVCTCVSSSSADGSADNTYHKARLTGLFKRLGWNVKVIEEGLAVILSERPVLIESDGTESSYSGIGISFGAGRSNCVLAYKGLDVIGISVARGGDWIDRKVSEQTDVPISQVISKKEKDLDFDNINFDDDVIFALNAYYESMIQFAIKHFAEKFVSVKSDFDAPLDIVIAGGTSMPKGFCKKVEEVVRRMNLPFKIKEVRGSADPRNAVVKGCLTQAMITRKKITNSRKDNEDIKNILGD
ncbi:MAG: hypothetical protein WDA06_00225 [Phenylobacterium sp.]